ncbi:DNA-binding SARP family transcriptional activator [Saccharothrix carnea]|uniref:DNA-binding SARP family transcriptional activator n=1 Tax=Saccharothrix carnea TaxID=1280637 RepID=A0A2P8I4A8_SACCR|nr:tetratricopeptide repeat protein [Saccharothrix carnea]PSL53298.1 DNA-binding SARP family transcriptional activator [Saccharothrix carnea]
MEIRLLGNVEIGNRERVFHLPRHGERCLLAVLALDLGRPVTKTTLAERIWDDNEVRDRKQDTLPTYVSHVRTALIAAGAPKNCLPADRAARGYVLNVDPNVVDYHRFAAETRAARDHTDPHRLRRALDLWRGPALSGLESHWADIRRQHLDIEYRGALETLLTAYLQAERHDEMLRILPWLDQRTTPDERLVMLGAEAYARTGRHTEIHAWATGMERRMREIHDTGLSDRAVARLRRLTADPTGPTLAEPDPAPPGPPSAMFSLRRDIPDFTGRDDDLRVLLDAVEAAADGPTRAIAIHAVDGMPGVGKTAFSVHAAHRVAHRFPDGRLFLDLHGHDPVRAPRTPLDALDSLLTATGIDPKVIPRDLDDRASLWRTRVAGKKILLILDDAATHDQVRPLLPGTPDSLVLITSRTRLAALDGVRPLTLDTLPPDDAVRMLLALAGRDPGDEDPDDLHRLVELCGHLPLAIALIAGQLRSHPTHTARHTADRLAHTHDRLTDLHAGDRSVRAAFDTSYRDLPADQRELFRLLGVHNGPDIDNHAAAALHDTTPDQARHHLEALHTAHLLQETSPGRYRLHDLLRVYAHNHAADLDPQHRHDATTRVLDHYLHTTHTAAQHLPTLRRHVTPITPTTPRHPHPITDAEHARAWLTTELPTLAAAIHHAAHHNHHTHAINLATTLDAFLYTHGHWDQAHTLHQTALHAATHTGDRHGQANALDSLGRVQRVRGEYGPAEATLTRALDLYTDLGNRLGQANALDSLGSVQYLRGEFGPAEATVTRALDLYTDLGNRLGQADALDSLGRVQRMRGEFGPAEATVTRALDLYTDLGNRLGQADALDSLGRVQYLRGEFGPAEATVTRALDLYTDLGNRLGQADALDSLGRVQYLRGEFGVAEATLTRALDLYTDLGDRHGPANGRLNLGITQHLRGAHEPATTNLTKALALFCEVGDHDGEAETHNALGELALAHPDAGDPHTHFTTALTLARDTGSRLHEANALAGQGRCLQHTDPARAITLLHQALTLHRELDVPEATRTAALLDTLQRDHPTTPEPPEGSAPLHDLPDGRRPSHL